MPYVKVHKDLNKFKEKVVLGLTFRQLICFGLAFAIGIPVYILLRSVGQEGLATWVLMLLAMPCMAFYVFTKNDQPLEKFLLSWINKMFLYPSKRYYATESVLDELIEEQKRYDLAAAKLNKKQKRPVNNKRSQKSPQKPPKQVKQNLNKKQKVKKPKEKRVIPRTVQQTIPFNQIFEDGLCEIKKGTYSKIIEFEDINYQISKSEDKIATFDKYCTFLNYFDSTMKLQISIVNQSIDVKRLERIIFTTLNGDDYDIYRQENNAMLRRQISQGKNSIQKRKYLTVTIEAENADAARGRFSRIEASMLNDLKSLKSRARVLDGKQWLRVLYDIYRHGDNYPFAYDYTLTKKQGLRQKDIIAPNSFNFRENKQFQIGDILGRVSYLRISAAEMSDEFLSELVDINTDMIVSIHLESIDQVTAQKSIGRKLTIMTSNKLEAQKKAVRAGYSMDIVSPALEETIDETKDLLEDLKTRNERLFKITFLVLNTEATQEKLDNYYFEIRTIAQKHNCDIQPVEILQEQGLASCMPLGVNKLQITRNLTTTSAASFIPFTTQELFNPRGFYYGLNALSRNLIMFDRKGQLKAPNGLILGTPGSGKSFKGKEEIINVLLYTNDDIIIIDPEREYTPLVDAFNGEVIKISAGSSNYINPMDLVLDDTEKDYSPLQRKGDFMLSLCDMIIGGRGGLSPVQKSIIDRCVNRCYLEYIENPSANTMPTLADFQELIAQQPDEDAKNIAVALELYTQGSLKVFANQTNIDLKNRFVAFDTKDLGNQLKTIGMHIVLDQVWNRITINRAQGRTTWIYIDEMHLMFNNEYSANFLKELWKRARKWGGIPTGITQNVADLLDSPIAKTMMSNTEFVVMLNQATSDREDLQALLNISERQSSYFTNTDAGQGLMVAGSVIIPFVDEFPTDTELYRRMTTKPNEVAVIAEKATQQPA